MGIFYFPFNRVNTKVITHPSKESRKLYLTANAKDIHRPLHAPPCRPRSVTLACSLFFRKIFPPKAEPYEKLLLNSRKLGLLDMESEFRGSEKKKKEKVWRHMIYRKSRQRRNMGMRTRKHTIRQKFSGLK